MRRSRRLLMLAPLLIALGGCRALTATNTAFPVSYSQARDELEAMRDQPVALARPVVFVGPFLDPGLAEFLTVWTVRRHVGNPDMVAGQSFLLWDSFDSCRAKTIRRVDTGWPSEHPTDTVEVDVVAFSMGGLVARYAAMPPDPARGQSRRLRIRRLYTIATPHRGADWAPLALFNALADGMEAGSSFLQRLDAAPRDYELVAYTRLTDWVVGEENTAPPGELPYWVSARPFEMAHVQAPRDARLLADILRRLRDEPPLTAPQPAPLPD